MLAMMNAVIQSLPQTFYWIQCSFVFHSRHWSLIYYCRSHVHASIPLMLSLLISWVMSL